MSSDCDPTFTPAKFFELSIDLVCIADATGHFLHVNPAWTTVLGWSSKELVARPFLELVHPDDVAMTLAEIARLAAGVPTLSFVNRYRRVDGSYRHLSWTCQPDPETGLFYAVARDITAHRAIESSLHQIFDATPTGLLLVNEGGDIAMANPCVAELLGYTVDELLGLPVEALVRPEVRSTHYVKRHEIQTSSVVGAMQQGRRVMAYRKDGALLPVQISLSGIEGMGEPLVLAAVLDQRQQCAFEKGLEDARMLAEDANQAKSQFLANMSHEIRTPLTAILGFADLLREEGSTEEQRVQTIDIIKNAGAHLLTVINDILDLSKIEAGKMTLERIDTPFIQVMREVDSLMRPRALGKGVRLRAALGSPVPEHIVSDPTRLRQILMNLVGNAVKFTEAGGVTLSARAEVREGQSRLIIDVEDTGPGMTPEQADCLFRPFGQADATVTRKHGGTGLGLTICCRLAGLMGGTVSLERTEPGRGSCFRVDLPLESVEGSAIASRLDVVHERHVEGPALTVKICGRVLLAEDGVDNQRLIAFHLRKAGVTVDVAENGVVALRMLDEAAASGVRYDLLLTDMQMPEMDGYTLARTLRERGDVLPIVALTAHAMADDRQKCTEAGCDDYVAKPIERSALLTTCATWVARGIEAREARRGALEGVGGSAADREAAVRSTAA
jgi:PAS domain S-box-containing protein